MKKLTQLYNDICSHYIKEFEQKHEVQFNFWVADLIGEIAVLNDYYFNFTDIRLDIDNDIPDGIIFDWYDKISDETLKNTNYYTYLKNNKLL